MQTNVRTPTEIFNQPQRLLVPLFQRPYVWNEEKQWEPLWNDVERVAGRLLAQGPDALQPHFLGAVVIQQIQNAVGDLQTRIVIDGQQRLTTLQILLDAVHAVFELRGFTHAAARLAYLVENAEAFCRKPEDRFKVWPTNKDRDAFNEVMGRKPPIAYDELKHATSRLAQAHKFFSHQAEQWLDEPSEHSAERRSDALEAAVSKLLQVVVIDLQVDENAQEIFETLNARGTPLTPVDLIKNFVFQRLSEEGAEVEQIYHDYWELYETDFWEEEILSGRLRRQRVVVFFNHWLVSMLGQDVNSSEVFATFKRFLLDRPELGTLELVMRIHRAARVYEEITTKGESKHGEIDRVGLFAYRTEAMQTDVVKPLLLALLDVDRNERIPAASIDRILDDVESWLLRRMFVRVTTKNYNRTMADLINIARNSPAATVETEVREYLTRQRSDSSYWPDDEMVRDAVVRMPIYKRISRTRMRMVLEAIEDHLRGYGTGREDLTGVRTPRSIYTIEHLMPQSWEANWEPPRDGDHTQRNERIHTLGNLTLVTQALNSKVSNGAWQDKERELNRHGVVLMNNRLIDYTRETWSDEHIDRRTSDMIDALLSIWRVPEGHVIETMASEGAKWATVRIADLLRVGLLQDGDVLGSTWSSFPQARATINGDGTIIYNNAMYTTPSGAGCAVRDGKATNGWTFWSVLSKGGVLLDDLRSQYLGEDDEESDDDLLAEPDDDAAEGDSSIRSLQHRFWKGLSRHLRDIDIAIPLGQVSARSNISVSINKPKVNIVLVCSGYSFESTDSGPHIRVDFRVYDNHPSYELLFSQREAIESEYGTLLTWYKVDGVKRAKIMDHQAVDIFDESRWPEYYDWLTERIIRMREVMVKRL
jgi:hypothetical protein